MRSNIFIFEGADVSGKSTQMEAVKQSLHHKGYRVVSFKYPDITHQTGKDVYEMLAADRSVYCDPKNIAKISMYNMMNKCETLGKLKEAADKNDVVLVDRWIISSLVYDYARLNTLVETGGIKLNAKFCKVMELFTDVINKFTVANIEYAKIFFGQEALPLNHFIFRESKAIAMLKGETREYVATDNDAELQKFVRAAYRTIVDKHGKLAVVEMSDEDQNIFQSALFPLNELISGCQGKNGCVIDIDKIIDYDAHKNLTAEMISSKINNLVIDKLEKYILTRISK